MQMHQTGRLPGKNRPRNRRSDVLEVRFGKKVSARVRKCRVVIVKDRLSKDDSDGTRPASEPK